MPSRLNWPRLLLPADISPLALEHVDGHGRLVVVGGGEDLAGLGRDGGVLLDELGHHAAQGLDAERQGRDVEEQHVLTSPWSTPPWMAAPTATASSGSRPCAAPGRRLPSPCPAPWACGLAADQDDVVDVADLAAGVLPGR